MCFFDCQVKGTESLSQSQPPQQVTESCTSKLNLRSKDPYTTTTYRPLLINNVEIGILATKYEARVFNDVRITNTALPITSNKQQFMLTCTQRIYITNNLGPPPLYEKSPTANLVNINYPVILEASMSVAPTDGMSVELLEYSPQTVNTSVQQSLSGAATDGSSASTSTTNGSSLSQSNTYGVSASVSAQGLSVTADASETQTHETSQSHTGESGTSSSREHSDSESMSIKEWAAYASVDPFRNAPVWTFGQEYPWNALQCRTLGSAKEPAKGDPNATAIDDKANIMIPHAMQSNLFDGTVLRQASDLAIYGLNFVTKAIWRVYADNKLSQSTNVTINHPSYLYSADHFLDPSSKPIVFIDNGLQTYVPNDADGNKPVSFDLNLIALDPIGVNHDTAAMGFIQNRFIPTQPTLPLTAGWKILSRTNDIIVTDTTDYSKDSSAIFYSLSSNCLSVGWPGQKMGVELTLTFKVIDLVNEYTLNLKHWLPAGTGIKLTVSINGDTGNSLIRYVQDKEGEGGDNNLLSIDLRNLDFSSINYHDYLQLGVNTIQIKIEPADEDWASIYFLRALSIVKH